MTIRTGRFFQGYRGGIFYHQGHGIQKMLNLMEKKELIARKRVEGDGRMKQIVLLPGGFRLQKEAVRVRNRMEEQICRNLTPKEREQFQMLSRKNLAGMGDSKTGRNQWEVLPRQPFAGGESGEGGSFFG